MKEATGKAVSTEEHFFSIVSIDKGNQQLNFESVDCKQIKVYSIGIYLVFP
jgi:hypothetical protein